VRRRRRDAGSESLPLPCALHTAARRYCLEQYAYWSKKYAELAQARGDRQRDDPHRTREVLDTFPRYSVLDAIRIELERIDPTTLTDLEDARSLLVLAGEVADNAFTQQPVGEIDARAVAEERVAFCRYVRGLQGVDLHTVKPLPYRRVLTPQESKSIWSRLRARWELTDVWNAPMDGQLRGLMVFPAGGFYRAVADGQLRTMVLNRGIQRVWELREFGPEYVQDVSLFTPAFNGAEGYWSSEDLEWVVYASHDGYVAVGGWLVAEVKALWHSSGLVWIDTRD